MTIPGRVHDGVVVLEGGSRLPEGAVVTVVYESEPADRTRERHRVQVPLVRSKHPGTLNLTNQRIAEILDEEDAAAAGR